MAAIMVIISGWIGLTYAVVGHIVSQATLGQFFLTWTTAGLTSLMFFAAVISLRRITAQGQTQTA